jgi:hypothetical protein
LKLFKLVLYAGWRLCPNEISISGADIAPGSGAGNGGLDEHRRAVQRPGSGGEILLIGTCIILSSSKIIWANINIENQHVKSRLKIIFFCEPKAPHQVSGVVAVLMTRIQTLVVVEDDDLCKSYVEAIEKF